MRMRAEACLARWREAERRHAQAPPGTLEWEQSRRDIVDERRRYQEAVDEITSADPSAPMPIPQPVD